MSCAVGLTLHIRFQIKRESILKTPTPQMIELFKLRVHPPRHSLNRKGQRYLDIYYGAMIVNIVCVAIFFTIGFTLGSTLLPN